VVQTLTSAPPGHYWTIQITDALTNVCHQLGPASGTPGGKISPGGRRQPAGFIDVPRMPTNVAGVFPRSFATCAEASKQQARAVLDQLGMYPLSEDHPGRMRSRTTRTRATLCSRPGSPPR
jgi:hypothetical protein